MAQENVFGHLLKPNTSQPAQPRQDPVIAVDPYRQADEARKTRDQQLQEDSAAREAERLRLAQHEAERGAKKDVQGSVEQGNSAGFLLRALGADDAYRAQELGARSYPGQKMAEIAPDALNTLPESVGNSPRRQVADSSQDEFIAATLRYESGAAIPPAELEAQRRRYFPMPGDSEDQLAAKSVLRRNAVEALKQSSGPLAEPTYQKFMSLTKTGQADEAKSLGESFGLTGSVTDTSEAPPAPPSNGGPSGPHDPSGPRDPSGLSGLGALAKQGVTIGLSDEAAGIGGYLSGFLTGEDPSKAYARERDTERAFLDRARSEWGALGTGAELLGAGGAARIASAPMTLGSVARQGSGIGTIGGFGYGEGEQSVPNALMGAAGGAALGASLYGAGRGLNALSRPRQPIDLSVVGAGQRQNIPIRQPDARPELRGRYAAAESGQVSGPTIRAARAEDTAAIESRVADIGGGPAAVDPYATGKTIQGAGQRYIAKTREQANRLYTRAREAAGNSTVTPTKADAALDANIQELKAAGENSNATAIKYLEGLRDDIDRGLTIEAAQNIRTNMRGQISERGLTGTDTERRVRQVIDAMTDDLAEQLPPQASQALRAADGFYKQRQEFINGTLKEFMGSRGSPLDAETASKRLVSMAQGKGKFDKFSAMWGKLEPGEQTEIAGQIAASLGRQQNGNFSPAMLIKSLDPASGISPRTARLVFGKDGAEALQDLRVIAQAKGAAMDRISPSGKAIAGQSGSLKSMMAALFGFSQGGPAGAIALPMAGQFIAKIGEQRAARMLLNPDFTKWLKNAPNTSNPKAIDAYFSKLAGIGSIAANDNQAFVGALRGAFSKSPGSAAAEDRNDGGGKPPANQGP